MHQLKTADGLNIEYVLSGAGEQNVLMLHGYADSWYSFNGMIRALPDNIRTYSISQRGHGRSDAPASDYSISQYANDAMQAMDAIGIEQVAIVGHSMGTFVAQEIALRYPNQVTHLVLIGSATTGNNELLSGFYDEVVQLNDPVAREFVHEFQAGTCVNPLGPHMSLDKIIDESMQLPARIWRQALRGLLDYRPAESEPDLSAITCPTLLLWGTGDQIFPRAEQDKLLALVSDAQLVEFEGAGHGLHWEKPVECANLLMNFIVPA